MTHTPGPWSWFGNARNHEIYLATEHGGRRYVMGFRRWGMRGAQPMFQPAERGLVPAEQLVTFEVGDRGVRGVEQAKADESVYRLDINGIDCADARLIAAAPDLLAALTALMEIETADIDMDEYGDDESIGAYTDQDDGQIKDLPLTFGHLRRARAAIVRATGGGQ